MAAATAGIVNANLFDGKSLNELAGMTQSASGSEAVRGFSYSGDNLIGIVGRNTVSAGLSAVVQGGSFADGFVRGMIGDFGAQGAKDIGTLWGNGKDPVLQTLAHMGLGGMIAGTQGDDVLAGVIGGGVESVYSNIAGKPLAGSTLGDIAYISGAMFVGGFASQLAGHDPSVAAAIAQNAAQNNYLYHHEAQELQEAEDQLRRCKDDTCRSQYQSTITELKNRDELRNQLLDNACQNPSSPECRRAYDDVRKAADSYAGTNYSGLLNVLGRESQEAQSKADMYGLRTQNPEGYNATTALVESVLAGTVSTFELATLAVLAGTGDPIAQQKLSAIAGSVGEFIAHPIDTTEQAIKQKLDQANQLEAQGRIDEAQRIRYGLIADGTLVLTGTGAVLASTGKTLASFGQKVESVAANTGNIAKNPLLDDFIPRNGDRLVVNQGPLPTCGHNSCGMVLDTMGKEVDIAKLIQEIPPTDKGIVTTDVANLMKLEGVSATAFKNRNVSDLARYTNEGTPVVVRIVDNTHGTDFSHFVVVDGVTTRNGVDVVAIRDPNGIQYFSPVETFKKNFTGEVVVAKGNKE